MARKILTIDRALESTSFMAHTVPRIRLACYLGLLVSAGGWIGCARTTDSSAPAEIADLLTPPDDLRQRLDRELESTFTNRRLSIEEHAAWQILHGALAYKQEFQVEQAGQLVSAIDHLRGGGTMKGWTTQPGVDLGDGRRGLQALLDLGSKQGQGHVDQWLAILAQCDLQPDDEIIVDGHTYTMADYVQQAQWDVPRNVNQEYSWTLISLTAYLPTNATWIAQDQREWSIEQLVERELEHELSTSACGGTHRMIGLAMALNRHLAETDELSGVWSRTNDRIQDVIRNAQRHQNPDGSFSTHYFERPGSSPDLAQNLGASGHILEFLTLAMNEEQLREPWVERAVLYLCDLFEDTRDVALECGALYHAAHGLVLYRERLFGPRKYLAAPRDPLPTTGGKLVRACYDVS